MQHVKELEVRGEMASPQWALAQGVPIRAVLGGCGASQPPCPSSGVPQAVLGAMLGSCLLAWAAADDAVPLGLVTPHQAFYVFSCLPEPNFLPESNREGSQGDFG